MSKRFSKGKLSTFLIYFVTFLFIISTINSLDECQDLVFDTDIPCLVLLGTNITETPCNTINVSFYNTSTLLYAQNTSKYNSFMCNATFNQTSYGTYVYYYSSGDSGSITVKENVDNTYYLYLIAFIIFFILLGLGYFLRDLTFKIIAGMLSCIIAINLFISGFPGLTNEFLRHSIITILLGIGFYFIISPIAEHFEGLK